MKHIKKQLAAITAGLCGLINIQAQNTWNLQQCIEYAISHNIGIKQKEAQQEQNAIELNTTQWSRSPNLSGSASHAFNFGRSIQADNTYKSLNTQNTGLSLSTSVPLFTGFQINNNIALAKLNLQAAVEDLNKAKEDISIQVASAYLQVLFNEELAKVADGQVKLSEEMLIRKTAFFNNGKASEAELREAQARVAQDRMSAVQAENNYRLALLELSQLLELSTPEGFNIEAPATDPEENTEILTPPSEIYGLAVNIKPSIKAAQYRLEGAARNIRIAQSGFYPQLSLGAGISTNYYNVAGMENPGFGPQLRDNFSQYIGLSLSIPIFDRFNTRNRVRQARVQHNTLNWQLEESKKTLYKEIQQAYYNALGAESKMKSSITADKAAEASFVLMKEKYENGKANATEYNEARTNWMKTVSERLQAKYEYLFRTRILDFYKGIPLELE